MKKPGKKRYLTIASILAVGVGASFLPTVAGADEDEGDLATCIFWSGQDLTGESSRLTDTNVDSTSTQADLSFTVKSMQVAYADRTSGGTASATASVFDDEGWLASVYDVTPSGWSETVNVTANGSTVQCRADQAH